MSQLYQDTLLPLSIKPLLFKYDTYQTYDLLLTERIGKQFNLVVFPRNFRNLQGYQTVTLFDRYTPESYQWADNYSTKLYFFWNPYTGSDYGDNLPTFYYGTNYFIEPDFDENGFGELRDRLVNEPFWVERPDYGEIPLIIVEDWNIPDIFTCDIPNDNSPYTGVITWLEYEDSTLQTAHKRYRIIDQHTKTIKIDCKLVAPCSFVVSGTGQLINLIESKMQNDSRAFLYRNLDLMLSELNNICLDLPSNVLHVASRITGSSNYAYAQYNWEWRSYGKEYKPSWYNNLAKLIYANNNYWVNGLPKTDLGDKRVYFYNRGYASDLTFSQIPMKDIQPVQDYRDVNPYAENDYEKGQDGLGYRKLGVIEQIMLDYGYEPGGSYNAIFRSNTYQRILAFNRFQKLIQFRDNETIKGLSNLTLWVAPTHYIYTGAATYPYERRIFHERISYDVNGSLVERIEASDFYEMQALDNTLEIQWYGSIDEGDLIDYLGDEEAIQLMLQDKFKQASS